MFWTAGFVMTKEEIQLCARAVTVYTDRFVMVERGIKGGIASLKYFHPFTSRAHQVSQLTPKQLQLVPGFD